ncbi:hypothetical protein [Streptomyces ardesiacus]|uniref:hypothetical protein n=1 Tax=Streptomyces ardesiacus TaxID=285564 RepID=UPI00201F1DFB|nr:hypothetical protein [Streptomyces ardesiacus]MCL7370486.1 hypothetical protein [Streptomyces ardesiacus]
MLELMEELKEWMDGSEFVESMTEQRNARKRMDAILKECADNGYLLYSRKIRFRTTGGVDPSPMTWWQAEVRAVPFGDFFKMVEEHLKKQEIPAGAMIREVRISICESASLASPELLRDEEVIAPGATHRSAVENCSGRRRTAWFRPAGGGEAHAHLHRRLTRRRG